MSHTKQQGFTIIELLLAIAMFAIVVPSLTVGITNLIVINNRSRDLALVNMLAQNKIEQLRSKGYNSVPTGTVSFTSELPATLGNPRSGSYTITNPSGGIKEVNITISYKDYRNTKTLQYRTIISEIGVGQ